jgi:methylated-DNA-protein-cysteine methyltransferase related protein
MRFMIFFPDNPPPDRKLHCQEHYFGGMKTIKLSEANADFFGRVYEVVKLVPRGRVTSYGAIANYLGAKRSSRMVGWAMNGCGKFSDVPAHRVVNRKGLLTGKHHFSPPESMEAALREEGIKVENDKVVDFAALFWDPMQELL